ncbi:MAG: hypothetical protein BWY63_02825 [Chloroflexi bacterium ADurb.Bin360]|nr:MAG: hypothetical protein BWY63_02825 [Chloroflexi bacterium ADurb.Bin360]
MRCATHAIRQRRIGEDVGAAHTAPRPREEIRQTGDTQLVIEIAIVACGNLNTGGVEQQIDAADDANDRQVANLSPQRRPTHTL